MIRFYTVRKASKPKPRRTPRRQMLLQRQMEQAITISLSKGIQSFKRTVSKSAMMDAWAKGDYSGVRKMFEWQKLPDHLQESYDKLEGAATESARISFDGIPAPVRGARFDMTNPVIAEHVKNAGHEITNNITKDGQAIISKQIENWMNRPTTTNRVAESLIGSVGLLEQHYDAVDKYRDRMTKGGVPEAQAERMANAYAQRLMTSRLKTIARTETAKAMAVGRRAVWENTLKGGLIDRGEVFRTWVHYDECDCAICQELDGQEVGFDESFVDSDGEEYDDSPAHPNCGCAVLTDVRLGKD